MKARPRERREGERKKSEDTQIDEGDMEGRTMRQ